MTILGLRGFARAKAAIDGAGDDPEKAPTGRMVELVHEIEYGLAVQKGQAEMAARIARLEREFEADDGEADLHAR